MLESEREKLTNHSSRWISIGVTPTGERMRSIHVPWYSDTQAYNMKTPDIYVTPADLGNQSLVAELASFRVAGFYAFCPLKDYGVLASFPDLMDLSLYRGEGVKSLDVTQSLPELRMLFLEGAVLSDLDPLFGELRRNFRCLALYDCRVDSLQSLVDYPGRMSEIIVANPKNRDERIRWKEIRACRVRYYDLRG